MRTLPEGTEIYDTQLPVGILGPIFAEYNFVSRFVAPIATPEQRAALATRTSFIEPVVLGPEGRFEPIVIDGFESPEPFEGLCGWQGVGGRAAVPLTEPAFAWDWAVRVGYLSGGEATGTIRLGEATQAVEFHKGLGEVTVHHVGGGSEVVLEDLTPGVNLCFGDVQVGKPVPDPADPQ